jgi:flagellar hook-basal body complex protein FliE
MTSPISGISFAMPTAGIPGITDVAGVSGIAAGSSTASTSGASGFAQVLAGQVDGLNAVQGAADALALQASTGDLQDAHDYMIASNEAKLATETVVTLKNSAIAAFTEIMRMPI